MTLLSAIAFEVSATLSLRQAVIEPGWYALAAIGYVGAFIFLAAVLRAGMGVGVAYAIWAALGVALTAVLAIVFFGERLTPTILAGVALVLVGVVLVELGSASITRLTPESAR